MTSPTSEMLHPELDRLHRGLATARDIQIARVVAVVDALVARGGADAVIAPLRPRLAQLRLRRPLRFCRLLFMPLDPLIVGTQAWRPDSGTIPRAALLPLAETVRAAMGDAAQMVDGMIRGHAVDDVETAGSAGGILWPSAAVILAESPPAAGWGRATLSAASCGLLTNQVAALLGQVPSLQALYAEADIGVALRPRQLQPLLAAAAAHGDETLVMMVALLLARLPETLDPLMQATDAGGVGMRVVLRRSVDLLLDRLDSNNGLETLVVANGLDQAGAEVRRIGQLLQRLPLELCPAWRARRPALVRRLEACCRLRFAGAVEEEFADALRGVSPEAEPAALIRLEDATRGLKVLQQRASQFGSPEAFDAPIRRIAALVKEGGPEQALSLIDRVRLLEILAGPDEALALLDSALPAV